MISNLFMAVVVGLGVYRLGELTVAALLWPARRRQRSQAAPESPVVLRQRWEIGDRDGEPCATVEADSEDAMLGGTLLALEIHGRALLQAEREGGA